MEKIRKKGLNFCKIKGRKRLRSLIAYNQRNTSKFHDLRYYLVQQEDLNQFNYKFDEKTRLAKAHKKIISDMIFYYKEHARNYMNKPWIILEKIYQRNVVAALSGKEPPVHSDILGLISSLPMLLIGYKAVRKNKGATTLAYYLSKDRLNKLNFSQQMFLRKTFRNPDGICLDTLRETSKLLKSGNYPWGASRRIWLDKPGSKIKGTRPITIPPFMDRVIQTCIKMVLEAIYEPWFENQNRSFGFRSNKGCHDAIFALTSPKCKNMFHAIEGDFQKAYDSVNKSILLNLLSKRIKDKKFINVMANRLDYQHYDYKKKQYITDITGIPQGGSDSPYLLNIYLSEFDNFMLGYTSNLTNKLNENLKKSSKFDIKTKLPLGGVNPVSLKLRNKIRNRKRWLEKWRINYSRSTMTLSQRYTIIREIRFLKHQIRKNESFDRNRQYLKFMYVRYADDWILLTNGPKLLAEKIKKEATNWAWNNLSMTLSPEKTIITDIIESKAHFLGFEIKSSRYRQIKKVKASFSFSTHGKYISKDILKKVAGQDTHAYIDRHHLISRMCMKGYCQSNGFPRELPFMTYLDVHTIIQRYNSVILGLFNYYAEFIRYKSDLSRWYSILKYSCLKTLAQKFRISIRNVLKRFKLDTKYGPTINIKIELKIKDEKYTKNWSLLTYKEALARAVSCNRFLAVKSAFYNNEEKISNRIYKPKPGKIPNVKEDNFLDSINWINGRTQADLELPCCLCGTQENIEMHHIRHVRKSNFSKISTYQPWHQMMSLRNRKQIPLCRKCHMMVHKGAYFAEPLINFVPKKLDGYTPKKLVDNRIVNIESYIKPGRIYSSKSLQEKGWELNSST